MGKRNTALNSSMKQIYYIVLNDLNKYEYLSAKK